MLRLRPHHILDIVRNIGNERPIVPHEYGHLLHKVTNKIITDVNVKCMLVIGTDDICGPCRMLTKEGRCLDILHQLERQTSKQEYNDNLDKRIMTFLNIEPNSVLKISNYLSSIKQNMNEIVDICTHPKEDKEYRRNGLIKGLKILKIE
ncbi:DUF1284 domain-containing protein [Sediminispirochaeta smaragdinae]|uniref:DUF1284 domain-containing protein n=1 Tax=Sediminispirochaeta smaragdinae (strain DSM 11293 / JCM 15392 / SEBR 4228) TaxID=573413 RepID=E1R1D5_SEDSS|nr:DUF1284 domain-containing protein [Sediminispirochaeta smaragdinae]ADK81076.1 hypothetical protein Spirs_1952 [Sediminispirochaeta smaragdinae DSM 11293]